MVRVGAAGRGRGRLSGFAALACAALALASGSAGAAPAPESAAGAPRIECSAPSFDFGMADSHQTVEHTFLVENRGTAPLEITYARTSCGCTSARVGQSLVPPGGRSDVHAAFVLAGRDGPQRKTITLLSNDPEKPVFELAIAGTIVSVVDVDPERLLFGSVRPGSVVTSEVRIAATGTNRVRVLKAGTSLPELAAEVQPVEVGRSYRLIVRAGPLTPGSPLAGAVDLETDSALRPAIRIPVAAEPMGEIVVAPAEIVLYRQGAQPPTRNVLLRPGTLASFRVLSVEPPDPSMRTRVQPWGEGGYSIQIDRIPLSPALHGRSLKITTSAGTMREIRIPFRVVGTPPSQPGPAAGVIP